jgi:hypothetical protein
LAALQLLVALFALSLFLAPAAQAGHVRCGDAITQDTTLDEDLVDCPGNGIVIAASGVTLDLNGHTIDGQGAGSGVSARGVRGDSPVFLSVTVEHGTIREFGQGIRFESAGGRVTRTRLVGNGTGLLAAPAAAIEFDRNRVEHNTAVGVDINGKFGEGSSALHDNVVRASPVGVALVFLDEIAVSGNRIERNSNAAMTLFKVFGGEVSHNTIAGNRDGLSGSFSRVPVRDNTISGNSGTGVSFSWGELPLFGNKISRNGGDGVVAGTGAGFTEVADNTIIGNGRNGVLVEGEYADHALPSGTITGNTVGQNDLDGISVRQNSRAVLVTDNKADRNGDDGIEVDLADATITGNHAWRNGDLGIEAVLGMSGTGNSAKHNGNPAQCIPESLCN